MLTAFTCEAGHPIRQPSPLTAGTLAASVWIDLHDATQEEVALVTEATGLHVPTFEEVSEIEASSRLIERDGVLWLSMPMIAMDGDPRVVSAGFVVSRERLLTVRFAASQVFETYAEKLPTGEVPFDGGARILLGLLAAIVDRRADALEKTHADLDRISRRIFGLAGRRRAGRKMEDRVLRATLAELGRVGDLISHVRESLLGVGRLAPFIEANTKDWLPVDCHAKLITIRDDLASLSDFDTHLADKMQFLLDATLGFINIAQSDVMKVMTIASVVGIPPVLVAGVYGMNFKNIPEYDWTLGYPFAWALILLTTIIPLGLFWWRKWI